MFESCKAEAGYFWYYSILCCHSIPPSDTVTPRIQALERPWLPKSPQMALKSTDTSIQNLSKKLQPQLDVSSLLDEWKWLQADQVLNLIL